MSKEKQNSLGTEQTVTLSGQCRTVLEELLVFILYFSVSSLIVLSIISVLSGIGKPMDLRAPRPAKTCGWPAEWCKFLAEPPKTPTPSIILEQPESKQSVPKYNQFLDYMLRP